MYEYIVHDYRTDNKRYDVGGATQSRTSVPGIVAWNILHDFDVSGPLGVHSLILS